MAKFKIFLRTFDTNKDGTHPICLRVAKDSQKKFISWDFLQMPTSGMITFVGSKKTSGSILITKKVMLS